MKKNIAIILSLILMMPLTQCKMNDKPTDVTETQPPSALEIVIAGKCNYTIVYPDSANATVINLARSIKSDLDKYTGSDAAIKTDFEKNSEYDDAPLEILVGDTGYKQTKQVKDGILYSEYAIKPVGNKIVITSWSSESLTVAAQQFIRQIKNNAKPNENGSIDLLLPGDMDIKGSFSATVGILPKYTGGRATGITNCGNGSYLLHIGETDKKQFDDYFKLLSDNGFSLYAENKIADNHFKTLVNENYTINMSYTAFEKSVRVTAEQRSALPISESEDVYQRVTDSSVTQIGLEAVNTDIGGMSYVIKLADGSFILIDGGFERDSDADRLFNVMREQAPNKNKITIAGWFITHAHGDHAGTILRFAEKYSGNVSVENFIMNFPMPAEAQNQGFSGEKQLIDKVFGAVYKFKGANIIKTHTGQVFHMRNAKVEMLYTLDDYRPLEFTDFNMTSIVFSVDIEGQHMMFLNDAHTATCNRLVKMYGENLKSDFVQLAHHGSFNAATPQIYGLIRPSVVLWPAGENTYKTAKNRPENVYLLSLDTVKEVHLAAYKIITIPLPWSPKS